MRTKSKKPSKKAGKGSKAPLLRGDSRQTKNLIASGGSRQEIAAARYADWLAQNQQKRKPE